MLRSFTVPMMSAVDEDDSKPSSAMSSEREIAVGVIATSHVGGRRKSGEDEIEMVPQMSTLPPPPRFAPRHVYARSRSVIHVPRKISVHALSQRLRRQTTLEPRGRINPAFAGSEEFMVALAYDTIANLIEHDDENGLRELLDSKAVGVDDSNEAGRTPLMLAAEDGKVRYVELLLNHGANVNAQDPERWTPLLLAAKNGHTEVVRVLLEHGASPDCADYCSWTPLLWASFKGHTDIAKALLEKKADPNVTGHYHATPLLWAAGRGHSEVVQELLKHGAKPNVPDKFGTTPLVWACRKGYIDTVRCLLDRGANVDTAGIYSWFPLLVAVQGGHLEIVNLLLQHKPNVNSLDKDGCPPLAHACKDGYLDIVKALLSHGAYVNVHDRSGDTMLIYAAKGGHTKAVEALLRKHAEVNAQGEDKKTALYCAVEKNHTAVVKTLLAGSIDVELATKEGDTPLMKAVRNRNAEIVQLLLDKKAKVAACDKKGDTALHIAMRGRQKTIVEILLRNPKNSQLLYRPNNKGETPYNMDSHHNRTILGQLFGARRLNMEQNENLLGYDLYSGALAEMLSEPSVSMPISVGLYAKWGSGKSFLLNKLKEDMKNFGRQWIMDPPLQLSTPLFLTGLLCSILIGLGVGLGFSDWRLAVGLGLGLLAVVYVGLVVIWYFSRTWTEKQPIRNFSVALARKLRSFKMGLSITFCHPPGPRAMTDENNAAQPIRFFFTDKAKLVSTTGAGVNIVVNMIASLYESVERDQGTFTTRLCRAFRPRPVHSASPWRFRRVCCMPVFLIVLFMFLCVVAMIGIAVGLVKLQNMDYLAAPTGDGGEQPIEGVLNESAYAAHPVLGRFVRAPDDRSTSDEAEIVTSGVTDEDNRDLTDEQALALQKQRMELGLMIVAATFGCILVGSASWLWRISKAIILSPRSQIRRALRSQVADSAGYSALGATGGGGLPGVLPTTSTGFHMAAPDSYLHALKKEVRLLSQIVQCLDAFGGRQSRLVVIVDGLDSCQQDQVLHVLDAIHLLFSDEHSPFIVILAIDPHIVIKAIEINANRVFQESNISGYDYLHSIVHLPFYLQNSSLRKVKAAQVAAKQLFHRPPPSAMMPQDPLMADEDLWPQRRMSNASLTSHNFSQRVRNTSVSQGRTLSVFSKPHQVKSAESLAGSISSNLHRVGTANMNHTGFPMSGAQDLTRVLLTDDYFNDVNPRSMRRLMNVVYVTGRLLKAFQIDFNWYNLAIWINITEQWPYRTSWLIYYYEWFADKIEDSTPLKEIYDAVYHVMPHSREIDPLVEIDRDEKKLSVFLSFHKSSLQIGHMKVFLPFTINLDPYLRKVIKEECPSLDELKTTRANAIPVVAPQRGVGHSAPPHLGDGGGNGPPVQLFDQPGWNGGDVGLAGQKGGFHRHHPLAPVGARRTTVAGRPTAMGKFMPPFGVNMAQQGVQQWHNVNLAVSPSELAANSFQMTTSAAMIVAKFAEMGCHSVRNVNVDGICSFLDALDGMKENSKESYKDALRLHNISGAVLLTCSLDDLKHVLGMTFGDWELFKQMVFFLRQRERDQGALGDHNRRPRASSAATTIGGVLGTVDDVSNEMILGGDDEDDDQDVVEGKLGMEPGKKYRLATVPSEEEKLGECAEDGLSSLGSAPFAPTDPKRRADSARSDPHTFTIEVSPAIPHEKNNERCSSAASNASKLHGAVRPRRGPGDRHVLEKQVTMEDHLIQGALQILSDEAVEDISAVTMQVHRTGSDRRTAHHNVDRIPEDDGVFDPGDEDRPNYALVTSASAILEAEPTVDTTVTGGHLASTTDDGETEVLYLRSCPPCASPVNRSEVGYGPGKQCVMPSSVVVVNPTNVVRSRYSSLSGHFTNSPMSSRSVSVRTLADADSILARLSPEKNWEIRKEEREQPSRNNSRAAGSVAENNDRSNRLRGRSDSFPEVGWGTNNSLRGSVEGNTDSAPGSPKSITAPFTPPSNKRAESIHLRTLRREESSSSRSLSRLSTLRRKLLGSSARSKTVLVDPELGADGTDSSTPLTSPVKPIASVTRSRNNSESKECNRRGRLRQLTYKSVVDSSSTSSDDDDDAGNDDEDDCQDEQGALIEDPIGEEQRRDFTMSTGYSTLEEDSKKSKGIFDATARRIFHMPSFRKSARNSTNGNKTSPDARDSSASITSTSGCECRFQSGAGPTESLTGDDTELLVLDQTVVDMREVIRHRLCEHQQESSSSSLSEMRSHLQRQGHVSSSRECTPSQHPDSPVVGNTGV